MYHGSDYCTCKVYLISLFVSGEYAAGNYRPILCLCFYDHIVYCSHVCLQSVCRTFAGYWQQCDAAGIFDLVIDFEYCVGFVFYYQITYGCARRSSSNGYCSGSVSGMLSYLHREKGQDTDSEENAFYLE